MDERAFRPPIELEGSHVRLVPLNPKHAAELAPIWERPEVNQYLIGLIPAPAQHDMSALVALLLARERDGTDVPFAVLRRSDGRPIGMTRFLHLDRANEGVEIGGTFYDPSFWRGPYNTEAKILLLRYAFESAHAHRVCLQTDLRNTRSQQAIARLGAVREAVLREDRHLTGGGYRSSVFFSILSPEWPEVLRSLQEKLARARPAPTDRTDPAPAPSAGVSSPVEIGLATPDEASLEFRRPVTLRGRFVELVPLEQRFIPQLTRAGRDPEVWRLLRIPPGRNEAEMTYLVEGLLRERDEGKVFPYVVCLLPDLRPVGIFRWLNIERDDRSIESGTWIESTLWRSPVNTEAKYLGMRHAFEVEHAHRVQFRTDSRNERSQRAIERLGATREGIHRDHFLLENGTYRTSVVYSLLAPEWPAAKRLLEEKLARPWSPPPMTSPGAPGAG
jgi:N-acetyltransferase